VFVAVISDVQRCNCNLIDSFEGIRREGDKGKKGVKKKESSKICKFEEK
jgi:hypothetical protein